MTIASHLLATALVALPLASACAQPSQSEIVEPNAEYGAFNSILSDAVQDAPGMMLKVSGPNMSYEESQGVANLETGLAMPVDATLRIGSITKTYVAALAILADKNGLVSLDDKISEHLTAQELSNLPKKLDPSVRQLLNHTSGIPDYYDAKFYLVHWKDRGALTTDLVFKSVKGKRATSKPGEEFNYSNTNYHLVALILERAYGKPLTTLFQEELFTPLGLTTTYYGEQYPPGDVIHGYGSPLNPKEDTYTWQENTGPDGGLFATSNDLEIWLRALFSETGQFSDVGDIMLSGAVSESKRKLQGYGVEILVSRDGWRVIGHTGSLDEYMTAAFYVPHADTVFVMHMNKSDDDVFSKSLGAILKTIGGPQ